MLSLIVIDTTGNLERSVEWVRSSFGHLHDLYSEMAAPPLGGNRPKKRLTNDWLVVSTHLKNIRQIGSFPQVGVKIKNL